LGSHPLNLALRFLLEVIALLSLGSWAWGASTRWYRYPLAIGLPLLVATIWGVFAVPDDPSRSGKAPIPTKGSIRLGMELLFFCSAAYALGSMGFIKLSWIFTGTVVLHYTASYDRIRWLLKQ